MKRVLALCGIAAALCLSAGHLLAQDEGGGGNRRGGGNGGGGGGGGGGGRGNFDPAQIQQQRLERARERLGFTNDVEWNAVQPLIQKIWDAEREVMANSMRFGRGGRGGGGAGGGGGGGGGGGRFGGMFGQPGPETEALQKAVEANAPTAQLKVALEKVRVAQKDREARLDQAQASLKKVLTTKQEAEAVLMGLIK